MVGISPGSHTQTACTNVVPIGCGIPRPKHSYRIYTFYILGKLFHSFIFSTAFPLGRVAMAVARAGREIPHGFQRSQIVLLAPPSNVWDVVTPPGPWTISGPLSRGFSQYGSYCQYFLGYLAPTNKGPSTTPNWNMKHCKLVEFLSNFRMSTPCTNVKSPHRRFSGDDSGLVEEMPTTFRKHSLTSSTSVEWSDVPLSNYYSLWHDCCLHVAFKSPRDEVLLPGIVNGPHCEARTRPSATFTFEARLRYILAWC